MAISTIDRIFDEINPLTSLWYPNHCDRFTSDIRHH
jgi:hypothetical protein